MTSLLWFLVAFLIILWLLGYAVAGLGNIVHLILIVVVVIVLYNLFAGRRTL